jgi:hypothetical protein
VTDATCDRGSPAWGPGYKGFRDRAAHDRAHELWDLPDWHPDAPSDGMRHMLRNALRRCLTRPGYCDRGLGSATRR